MKKTFVLALVCCLFSFVGKSGAEDVSLFSEDDALEKLISSDEFLSAGDNFSVASMGMPSCNNVSLRENLFRSLQSYLATKPQTTLLERRKQTLILKNITTFEEVSPEKVNPKTDVELANEIILTKINMGIPTTEMKVCRCTNNIAGKNLYIFMYKKEDNIFGKVINFTDEPVEDGELSFFVSSN
ncbi:MAG: hypothetical protein PHE89_08265 [Alphaproteobacteria bacterium]|nr:hypothetical protein [Alphaproteobacteria bacterium]